MEWAFYISSSVLKLVEDEFSECEKLRALVLDVSQEEGRVNSVAEDLAYSGVPILCRKGVLPKGLLERLVDSTEFMQNEVVSFLSRKIGVEMALGNRFFPLDIGLDRSTKELSEEELLKLTDFLSQFTERFKEYSLTYCLPVSLPNIPGSPGLENSVRVLNQFEGADFGLELKVFLNELADDSEVIELVRKFRNKIAVVWLMYDNNEGIFVDRDTVARWAEVLQDGENPVVVTFQPSFEEPQNLVNEIVRLDRDLVELGV